MTTKTTITCDMCSKELTNRASSQMFALRYGEGVDTELCITVSHLEDGGPAKDLCLDCAINAMRNKLRGIDSVDARLNAVDTSRA